MSHKATCMKCVEEMEFQYNYRMQGIEYVVFKCKHCGTEIEIECPYMDT